MLTCIVALQKLLTGTSNRSFIFWTKKKTASNEMSGYVGYRLRDHRVIFNEGLIDAIYSCGANAWFRGA